MYGQYSASAGPKCLIVVLHLAGVAAAAWLLFGGMQLLAVHFGKQIPQDYVARSVLLLLCSVIYFFRLLATLLVMQKSRVMWKEAAGVGIWLIIIHGTMAAFGSSNPDPMGAMEWAGMVFYLLGSFLNTGSEYQRMRWKKRPENQGRLYTGGLFHYSMHINYFGDVVLFTGFALITGIFWALIIPGIMLCLFVFVNIPMLDKYLEQHYGAAFIEYSSRTSKLIPFLY